MEQERFKRNFCEGNLWKNLKESVLDSLPLYSECSTLCPWLLPPLTSTRLKLSRQGLLWKMQGEVWLPGHAVCTPDFCTKTSWYWYLNSIIHTVPGTLTLRRRELFQPHSPLPCASHCLPPTFRGHLSRESCKLLVFRTATVLRPGCPRSCACLSWYRGRVHTDQGKSSHA